MVICVRQYCAQVHISQSETAHKRVHIRLRKALLRLTIPILALLRRGPRSARLS